MTYFSVIITKTPLSTFTYDWISFERHNVHNYYRIITAKLNQIQQNSHNVLSSPNKTGLFN